MKNIIKTKVTHPLALAKLFLSSLTARSCRYLYLNCTSDKQTLAITNGDISLLNQESYSISVHLIKFKRRINYLEYLDIFKLRDITEPYIVLLPKLLKVANTCLKQKEFLRGFFDESHQLMLTSDKDMRDDKELIKAYKTEARKKLVEDILAGKVGGDDDDDAAARSDEILALLNELDIKLEDLNEDVDISVIPLPTLEYSHACGTNDLDFRTCLTLEREIRGMESTYTALTQKGVGASLTLDHKTLSYLRSNVFNYPFKLSDFRTPEGLPYFDTTKYKDNYSVLLQDGLDVPSVKELVSKLDNTWDIKLQLYTNKNERNIKCFTILENDTYIITSSRPFASIYPIHL